MSDERRPDNYDIKKVFRLIDMSALLIPSKNSYNNYEGKYILPNFSLSKTYPF